MHVLSSLDMCKIMEPQHGLLCDFFPMHKPVIQVTFSQVELAFFIGAKFTHLFCGIFFSMSFETDLTISSSDCSSR